MIPLFYLLTWKNGLEITLISLFTYYIIKWLATDRTKLALLYFYGYCFCGLTACVLQLPTVINFLIWLFPVIAVVLALFHSESLQRNFVALKKISPKKEIVTAHWIEELVRACLNTQNQGLTNYFVIECTDTLEPFVDIKCPINAPANQELIDILMHAPHPHNTFILLNNKGSLLGCRCRWKTDFELNGSTTWFTEKLDCLVVISTQQGFSLIHSAKIIEQLTGPQVCTILKHVLLSTSDSIKKGIDHDQTLNAVYKKSAEHQSHS